MRIEALISDTGTPQSLQSGDANAFGAMLADLGAVLQKASGAEDRFASGRGDLQTAVYERAQADVALSVATAAAQRSAQALQSILNMQV